MKYLLSFLSFLLYSTLWAQSARPIAIVELFTSQGCSSCPSADRLLREAVNAQNENGEVYGLSFHVSYWNRLGWTDPYSSTQYTERQKWYAEKMGLGRIYTPQMIVDGNDEFVGSQKNLLLKSLKSSFESNTKTEISIIDLSKKGQKLNLSYVCQSISRDELLNIAVVQAVASNHVPRGENKDKKLVHSNVVRAFYTFPAKAEGSVSFELPELLKHAKYEVIAYTQNKITLEISSVGRSQF
ncbi:hypothetical protein SAMN04488029_1864 [Reichenbachiella faecimaris]|uniref:DUF1223 domain-containing protein n=1 Tax=Reichenbachiella faecimaris TaxID=692418 RepID=A0A1W2GBU4_REIFA|nr:DUF1223 domain-containing protein [Reichenbachiella faecimaris]SMD34140.1 hypothetical protein SAMN04488029_1864 [Reichenbachiella faecimaris]